MKQRLIHALAALVCLTALNSHVIYAQGGTPEATAGATAAPVMITVQGRVTNGTANAKLPNTLKITLHIIGSDPAVLGGDPNLREIETRETTMAADGRFTFANVPGRANDFYVLTTNYAGGAQASQPATFVEGQTVLDIPLTIYEVSPDPSIVRMTRSVTILDFASFPGIVQVFTAYDFTVSGDHAFLTTKKTGDGAPISVTAEVPSDAQKLEIAGNEAADPKERQFALSGTTVQDTLPVLPGQTRRISLKYQLVYHDDLTMTQVLPFGASEIQVLIPAANDKIKLTGSDFSGGEPYKFEGSSESFVLYKRTAPAAAGGAVRYQVKGAPPPFQSTPGLLPPFNPLPPILIGGGVILLVIAAILLWTGRKSRARS